MILTMVLASVLGVVANEGIMTQGQVGNNSIVEARTPLTFEPIEFKFMLDGEELAVVSHSGKVKCFQVSKMEIEEFRRFDEASFVLYIALCRPRP